MVFLPLLVSQTTASFCSQVGCWGWFEAALFQP